MDIVKLGTELLASKLGDSIDTSDITAALGKLLGSDSGDFDISSLVSNMMKDGGGLQSIVSSWLGDGDNDAISTEQIADVLGGDKVSSFASSLGVDEEQAGFDLADIIPQLIDKSSSGGSLFDSIGGLDGLVGIAKKLF